MAPRPEQFPIQIWVGLIARIALAKPADRIHCSRRPLARWEVRFPGGLLNGYFPLPMWFAAGGPVLDSDFGRRWTDMEDAHAFPPSARPRARAVAAAPMDFDQD